MANPTTEAIYQFIADYIEKYDGHSPSQKEIAEACFLPRGSVYNYLNRLEIEGRIYREPGVHRSIRLIKKQ
jgi:DNA-binding MarR family transcriptional regulator